MDNQTRQDYIDLMNAQLKELTARIELGKAQASQEIAGAKINLKNRFKEFRDKEAQLRLKIEKIKDATSDRYEILKTEADVAWKELGSLVRSLTNS